MYDIEWKKQATETIKRNREALGLPMRPLRINMLLVVNHLIIRDYFIADGELILADGLIIGLDSELEVNSND